MQAMVEALCKEIELRQHYLPSRQIRSIYLGGGTPSLLDAAHIQKLLEVIHTYFQVSTQAEITLEANPDDLNNAKLEAFLQIGINRLSIGVQSFQDEVLKRLHRLHSAQQAIDAVHHARQVGFERISIDLMYAIPGMSNQHWFNDLQQALALEVGHIAAYCLTIEEKTVFGRWLHKGRIHPVDEEAAANQMAMLIAILESAGFIHYEISNFARPGHMSRHNSAYWQNLPYLGIGPGAHSYDGSSRQYNIANNALYLRSLQAGTIPAQQEKLSKQDQANEYLLTRLRTIWGIHLGDLRSLLSMEQYEQLSTQIHMLIQQGLLEQHGQRICLSQQGIFIADKIIEDLFIV